MLFLRLSVLLIGICGASCLAGKVEAGTVSALPPKLTGACLSVSAVAVAHGSANESGPTWQELRGTLTDDSKPYSPRYMALRSACRNSEEESAPEVLEIIGGWLLELEAAGVERIRADEVLRNRRSLVNAFLPNCVAPLEEVLDDQRPLLELLERFAVSKVLPGSGAEPVQAIVGNPAAKEVRREVLLSIIARRPTWSRFWRVMYRMFDASTLPRLRELVRTSGTGGPFNALAAHILAHHGDQEILPELRAWQARLLEQSPKEARYAEAAIWRIEVQHPPSKLLEHIAATGGWRARPWAIERAIELGLPREGVRTAILRHAEQIAPVGEKRIRPGLFEIKRVALELSILHEGDLPDVELPRGRPTP